MSDGLQVTEKPQGKDKSLLKSKRFLIGGVLILAALGYIVYAGLGSATYYFTVSEFKAKGDSIYGKNVRVSGEVVADSIERDADNLVKEFDIADESESLHVVYSGGGVPSGFEDGASVVVEGRGNSDGVFLADSILTQCPSRYEPEGED